MRDRLQNWLPRIVLAPSFFLILFFFSIGASFNLSLLGEIIVPSIILAVLVLGLKPIVFRYLLSRISESKALAWEVGFRLGQISEFSLLIAYIATAATWRLNCRHLPDRL